jgi:hypothetical protein
MLLKGCEHLRANLDFAAKGFSVSIRHTLPNKVCVRYVCDSGFLPVFADSAVL